MKRCFYCNDIATCKDHPYPASLRGKRHQDDETVPCCTECNQLLKNFYAEELFDRFTYIMQKIMEKYKFNWETIRWTEEEMKELGPNLQAYIKAQDRAIQRCFAIIQRQYEIRKQTSLDGIFQEPPTHHPLETKEEFENPEKELIRKILFGKRLS